MVHLHGRSSLIRREFIIAFISKNKHDKFKTIIHNTVFSRNDKERILSFVVSVNIYVLSKIERVN